ncbi:nucleotidyltransferase [Labrenzia sp. CP4]|jgi:protein ImuB|uniref:Y-family DNA polymerase n=1 Tax=Labrenzia sp. CP4 TaxID=1674922 RepID=UPI000782B783|nr:DNA polymerase Y family protein [Labrenzia sp. CP4]AMN55104.1 nucleotidyltransferase [Labrenzia sp. CP4]
MQRRIVSLWFPRLAAESSLRARPVDAPFALSLFDRNSERLYDLCPRAESFGLNRGMMLVHARSFCPGLLTRPADPAADQRFLRLLARWATRYCPWVGLDGRNGLFLDITGSAHLLGGEEPLLDDIRARLARAGLTARLGLADTPGTAWALSRFAEGIAGTGETLARIGPLPLSALRLSDQTCTSLERLGIATVSQLYNLPRATVARRYEPDVLRRLDQALGALPEQISPLGEEPGFAVRMTLPDPIGLLDDVMAAARRLTAHLCQRLDTAQKGARSLKLTFRRVDQENQAVELKLARPMRDPERILALFERGVSAVDAGYGIDMIRLEATEVEPLGMRQLDRTEGLEKDGLDDLITQLGNRVGLDNILRFQPVDSHIPERSFKLVPAAYSRPAQAWPANRPRPIRLFAPEPISGTGFEPPRRFRWRGRALTVFEAEGPERITPAWWDLDDSWAKGLRDYWRIATHQGQRLWLFHTPQHPAWFVQGEFG